MYNERLLEQTDSTQHQVKQLFKNNPAKKPLLYTSTVILTLFANVLRICYFTWQKFRVKIISNFIINSFFCLEYQQPFHIL